MPGLEKTAIVDKIVALSPEDVVAHRLGDFLFTHHGIDFGHMNPRLWTVVAWPDPQTNQSPGTVTVGLLDGNTSTFRMDSWEQELKAQNALRIQNSLAALPELAGVTTTKPARAPAEEEP